MPGGHILKMKKGSLGVSFVEMRCRYATIQHLKVRKNVLKKNEVESRFFLITIVKEHGDEIYSKDEAVSASWPYSGKEI